MLMCTENRFLGARRTSPLRKRGSAIGNYRLRAVSFLCPSQLDAVRFSQLFQRFSKTVHAGLLIVKLL
jgi:hypothetical protein